MSAYRARLLAAVAFLPLGLLVGAPPAWAAPTDAAAAGVETAANSVDEVVVTGTRGSQARTVADSPVPIDIVGADQIAATGKTGLKEILSTLIPSLYLPAQNGGGTSASVRPYAIRGVSGDYLLVLVNGKRRHSTALINNLATVSAGSTPVDIDLIPAQAIQRIEVLRDGAAAQYGSDAIAGVINIILKNNGQGGQAQTTLGRTYSDGGALLQQSVDFGRPLFGGDIHFTLQATHQEPAPAGEKATGILYPLVGGALDPREATGDRYYSKAYGRSTRTDALIGAYDLSVPVGDGLEFYSFSTLSYRELKDRRGAYRPANLSALPQIFPNGFQTYRRIHEWDGQVAAGLKGESFGWTWDISTTYGRDDVWLGASSTLNASLGPSVTQTSFFLGKQIFDQWTNNLDVTRAFDVGFLDGPLDVSWGLEHRWERFEESAGEPNSYRNGNYQVVNDGTPFGVLYAGRFPTAGLQSFTGTTPDDEVTLSRNNVAAYVDVGANVTKAWYVGVAARAEHYSDSAGDTLSGKFTTRYEILPGLALRGAVSNGFRAPSLAQAGFSTTQNTSGFDAAGRRVSFQSKFLRVDSPEAKALGATPLTPEKSLNYSLGVTFEPFRDLRITLDAYQIDITDRIVKSEQLSGPAVTAILAAKGFSGLTNGQYFTNAVDTRTRGVDFVAEYQQSLGDFGRVHWSVVVAGNATKIRSVKPNPAALNSLGSSYVLFGRLARRQLTVSAPRDRITLGADWRLGKLAVNLRNTRYGKYVEPSTVASGDLHFSPKWIADLDISYDLTPSITVSAGANNLFAKKPDRIGAIVADSTLPTSPINYQNNPTYGLGWTGSGAYGTNSPFGLNGGFYYTRLGFRF